jgi:hypothetical protein
VPDLPPRHHRPLCVCILGIGRRPREEGACERELYGARRVDDGASPQTAAALQ